MCSQWVINKSMQDQMALNCNLIADSLSCCLSIDFCCKILVLGYIRPCNPFYVTMAYFCSEIWCIDIFARTSSYSTVYLLTHLQHWLCVFQVFIFYVILSHETDVGILHLNLKISDMYRNPVGSYIHYILYINVSM